MHYAPGIEKCPLPFSPFKSCTVPRPIGWLSTVSEDGIYNLAPYSQWQNLTFDLPMVMFAANQLSSGENNTEEQRLLEQSSQEVFQEDEMEYVELDEPEQEQYSQQLRYLDEPNKYSIYSDFENEQDNYNESKDLEKLDALNSKITPRNNKNRSIKTREEEPLDVEPLENSSQEISRKSKINDNEIIDIEDPW